eukprot:TRINITY_DN8274_c0_g1_i16.p2 TRINITY_DN8274_c0_g1~~TRINITY_DN8274_c0_g1_i16.p2  ORF type:complete len:132 (+),score=32.30 TRINITY_DN8274_c0_g1_i16:604-999(+)
METETGTECLSKFMQFTSSRTDSLIEFSINLKAKFLSSVNQIEDSQAEPVGKKKLWMANSVSYFGRAERKAADELELQQFPLLEILSSSAETLRRENVKYNSEEIGSVIKKLENAVRELKPQCYLFDVSFM